MRAPRSGAVLRVNLVYQALPEYRVAVWRELARRPGIDLTVFHGSTPGLPSVEAEGFRAIPIADLSPAPHRMMVYPRLLGLASRKASDVLVAPWTLRSALLVPAVLRAKASGVGTVLWGHGYSKQERPRKLKLRERQGKLADALVFYDQRTAAGFERRHPRFEGAFVAKNTIDLDAIESARARHAASGAAAEHTWRDLGFGVPFLERRGPIALHVSRLADDNGVEVLIDATARVPDMTSVVVGAGPREARLRALAEAAGVQERVRFVGDRYREDELAPLFALADLFVYPKNVGLSLIHALAYGVPVLTGDDLASHNPEVCALEDGVNGALFRHGDAAALAGKIQELFAAPDVLGDMSRAARANVHRDFPMDRMVDGLEQAIRHAAARRRGD